MTQGGSNIAARRTSRAVWAGVLTLAAVVRLVSCAAWRPRTLDDSIRYLINASELATLDFSTYLGGRTPGYPLFLALLGRDALTVVIVQAVLGIVSVALVYELTWRITGRTTPAACAAAVQAVFLPAIGLETYLYTETLATALLCGTLLAAERGFTTDRRGAWATSGVLAAAAVLTRPELAVVVAFLGAVVLARRAAQGTAAALVVIAPTVLALLGLATFNAVFVGQFTVTTFTGFNLMNHVGPFIDDAPPRYHDIVALYLPARAHQLHAYGNPDQAIWLITDELSRRSPEYPRQGAAFAHAGRRLFSLAVTQIWSHPAAYARSVAESWLMFWTGHHAFEPERLRWPGAAPFAEMAAAASRWLQRLTHLAFLACCVAVTIAWRRQRSSFPEAFYVVGGAVLVGSIAPSLLEHGQNTRFSIPYAPLMITTILATGSPFPRASLRAMRMVQCVKLGREGEGLDRPPFNNDLGKRIFENISKEAWKGWLAHSTMLINEYRVDLLSKQGTDFLLKECEKYFYGEGSEAPKEFVAPDAATQSEKK